MVESSARQAGEGAEVERTLDESGTVLGERYRLLRPLGEGGAGIVYAAIDERIGAEVAIKVVRGSARRDEITLARFHREAKAAGKLGHPNIVRVTDFGKSSTGSPYVVMERLDGETLEARIQRLGKLDPATAIDVHVQLADALAAAHAAGVLHRDVKPANVFLTQLATGKVLVKLLDFGLAELYQEPTSVRLTERGLLVGSLAYLAPERILGAAADEQSDVYGIGASLHESLTGELPFSAPNPMMMRARILAGEVTPLEEVPAALAVVTRECLAREPKERIGTAAEVRRRLLVAEVAPTAGSKAVTPSSRPPTSAEAVTPPPVREASRAPWLALIALSLATLAAAAWAYGAGSSAVPAASAVPASAVPVASAVPASAVPVPSTAVSVSEVALPPTSSPPPTSPPPPSRADSPPRTHLRSHAPPPSENAAPPPSEAEDRPSRFDQIQEPDWGAPLPQ